MNLFILIRTGIGTAGSVVPFAVLIFFFSVCNQSWAESQENAFSETETQILHKHIFDNYFKYKEQNGYPFSKIKTNGHGIISKNSENLHSAGIKANGISAHQNSPENKPPVYVVCFVPSDMSPYPETRYRLDRVMNDLQNFYRKNMTRQGFGSKTFDLERAEDGLLKVHFVYGSDRQQEYTKDRYMQIRDEVKTALLKEKINIDREYVVIFQLLLKREKERIVEIGPFVGGGTSLNGTAWVYDDPQLDPQFLKGAITKSSRGEKSIFENDSLSVQYSDPFFKRTSDSVAKRNNSFAFSFDRFIRTKYLNDLSSVIRKNFYNVTTISSISSQESRKTSPVDFNVYYLGGTAHEIGHMFGLVHNAQTNSERDHLGLSIMGIGNRVYGQERLGSKTGAFLTKGDALRLSRCRAFAGDLPFNNTHPTFDILELRAFWKKNPSLKQLENTKENSDRQLSNNSGKKIADEKNGSGKNFSLKQEENTFYPLCVNENPEDKKTLDGTTLVLSGKCRADIPLAGLILSYDSETTDADYDAITWTAFPDREGEFYYQISELRQGAALLRLTAIHENGKSSSVSVPCFIDEKFDQKGLAAINSYVPEQLVRRLFQSWNTERMREVLDWFERHPDSVDPVLKRKTAHLYRLMTSPSEKILPAEVPNDQNFFDLSNAVFLLEKTGNGRPLKGTVPDDLFLSVNGQFFESGLYAYAPSVYQTNLNGRWSKFQFGYGLQDGYTGSVFFIVRADGREIFRSPLVHDNELHQAELEIRGVQTLELQVEQGNDGNSLDKAVWVNLFLFR